MRILYVCSDFGIAPCGTKGASIHLRAITRALAQAGHEVVLLSPKPGPDGDHPAARLLPPGCPPVDGCGKLLKRWMVGRGLGDAVAKELRPLLYNAWVEEPAYEALCQDPPVVVLERLSLFGHVGLDLADRLGCPLIVEVNALLTEEARAFRSLEMRDLARRIERRVLERADAVMAVSAPLAKRIAGNGVPQRKVHVVPNGVDPSVFETGRDRKQCRADLGLSDDQFVVGFVGSLKPWHGVTVLLDAFARLRALDGSAHLLVVGSGPMQGELEQIIRGRHLTEAVTLTGAVDHHRVAGLMVAMDVATAPFVDLEDFYFSPIKVFEYMAAGTCVAASDQGQIAEVIQHRITGLLCPPNDPQALFENLDWARKSPRQRQELADRASRLVRQSYTWNHTARKVLAVVADVTARNAEDRASSPRAGEPCHVGVQT